MKIYTEPTQSHSGFRLLCEPDGEADGQPPIPELLIDTLVQNLSRERLAVAGALAFGEFIANELVVDREISRLAQSGIADFFAGRRVTALPATDVAKAVWPSSGTMHLDSFVRGSTPPLTKPGEAHDYYVEIADGVTFNGAIASAHKMVVASNAAFLARLDSTRHSYDYLLLALGVLLSEDTHMRNVHLCEPTFDGDLISARMLLRSVGLNLSWTAVS